MKERSYTILLIIYLMSFIVHAQNFTSGLNQVQIVDGASYPQVLTFAPEEKIFSLKNNWAHKYGSRFSGYFCPPQTGIYYFWIACNDAAELWLSPDSNPANKIKIAQVSIYAKYRKWTKSSSQKSVAIYLQAGQQYYIAALQKDGTNTDPISVGMQLPDGSLEKPISGTHFSPYDPDPTELVESSWLKATNTEDSNCSILVYCNLIESGILTLGVLGYSGKSKAGIRIIDIDGKNVYSSKAIRDLTSERTLINIIERFPPGIYSIYVDIGKKMYYQKLIVK